MTEVTGFSTKKLLYTAIVKFYDTDNGGRLTNPLSGYRPLLKIDDVYFSCPIETMSGAEELFDFNVEHKVFLWIGDQEHVRHLRIGEHLAFYEGGGKRLVAEGTVLSVNEDGMIEKI